MFCCVLPTQLKDKFNFSIIAYTVIFLYANLTLRLFTSFLRYLLVSNQKCCNIITFFTIQSAHFALYSEYIFHSIAPHSPSR